MTSGVVLKAPALALLIPQDASYASVMLLHVDGDVSCCY